jgi:hypothetical protein
MTDGPFPRVKADDYDDEDQEQTELERGFAGMCPAPPPPGTIGPAAPDFSMIFPRSR